MSKRAEIAALRAYPKEDEKVWHSAFGIFKFDKNAEARKAYQEGYEQAKKDLALTKDDVKSLIEIWMNLPDFPARSLSQIAEETLDIFNEQRKK